jgi:hypothetical protein
MALRLTPTLREAVIGSGSKPRSARLSGATVPKLMEAAMSGRIKFAWTLLGTIIFAIAVVNTASAGSLEDAIAAKERGDYAIAMRLL